MSIHEQLLCFVQNIVFPYILDLDIIKKYMNSISVLLVGSVATGLCDKNSDVDICLLCNHDTFSEISANTGWRKGRPTQIVIDGIQIHYYAISFDSIVAKLAEFDDIAFYVYGTAVPLNDNANLYKQLLKEINSDEIKANRLIQANNTLLRRRHALYTVLQEVEDPIVRIELCIEIIRHIVMSTALKDGLQFDPRKRPIKTALAGSTGNMTEPRIDEAIHLISGVSNIQNIENIKRFIMLIDQCIEIIIDHR